MKTTKKVTLPIIFFIFFMGLLLNIPAKISYEGVADIDWWSNDILLTDLMRYEDYGSEDLFLYSVTPSMLCPKDANQAYGEIRKMFIDNMSFDKNYYKQYTSNIVLQRYLFRGLIKILPISREAFLHFLYIFYCLLASAVLTLLFYWIIDIAGSRVSIISSIVLALICPYFAAWGRNVYWSMWSMFFPIAMMSYIAAKGGIKKSITAKEKAVIFITAFVSCGIKMAVCFEFMTSVMVAMTIPIFYVCIKDEFSLKETIKNFIWSFFGAIASFITIFGIKTYMLIRQYGLYEMLNITNYNLGRRLFGTVDSGIESLGPIKTTILMCSKEFISIKGCFKINFSFAVLLCLTLSIYMILYKKVIYPLSGIQFKYNEQDRRFFALQMSTSISILGPLSWFILAAPHTTIHNQFATINWFVPFGILWIVCLIMAVEKICNLVKTGRRNE